MVAKIALKAATYAIDRPYDYAVPAALDDMLKPGMRVIVPFGAGNRRTEGIVLAAEDRAGESLKPVLALLDEGPVLDGEAIRPAQVEMLRQSGRTALLSVTIHEGKNRQIRRMCAACGLTVKRLRRVREHTLELGDLPLGKWRYLTEAEIAALKHT